MPKKSGFTLIELLVVISIIAILSIIGLTAYTTFTKNARDAKRQSDLKFIQSALEEYHADQTFYPAVITPGTALTSTNGSKTYMSKIPNDPTKSTTIPYLYKPLPLNCDNVFIINCTSYCIFAATENISKTEDSVNCLLSADYQYAVTRP